MVLTSHRSLLTQSVHPGLKSQAKEETMNSDEISGVSLGQNSHIQTMELGEIYILIRPNDPAGC
jgi:hypothetical protein